MNIEAQLNRVPRLSLGNFPTPIEEMPRLRAALGGGPRLFIKREDYAGLGFGGNKVRKLEYMLAQALDHGADTVVTCGAEKSNHCRITAALCARLGLRCVLILCASRSLRHPVASPPASGSTACSGQRSIASRGARIARPPWMSSPIACVMRERNHLSFPLERARRSEPY
jgi:1-aminocyclopropane-1-carboxylate deaminase/D-cysteine desulfhydrase-like pyridoxal-dependent ACC family enzyme